MPKEKINHAAAYLQQIDPLADMPEGTVLVGEVSNIEWNPLAGAESPGAWVPDAPITRDAELAVGWLKDSWIQLSIEGEPSYFRMAAESIDGEDGRTSVYTPPLSRDEVNKLIRSLRRARDQVFGRDE